MILPSGSLCGTEAPYQNGIDLKVGVFDSIIGYESVNPQ